MTLWTEPYFKETYSEESQTRGSILKEKTERDYIYASTIFPLSSIKTPTRENYKKLRDHFDNLLRSDEWVVS